MPCNAMFGRNVTLFAFMIGFGVIATSYAEESRLVAAKARAVQITAVLETLPPAQRRVLSSAAQNILQFAHKDEALESPSTLAQEASQLAAIRNSPATPAASMLIPVNDPRTDFLFSIMTGFTQSETSAAWCGTNVSVGFNDSNSLLQTLLLGPGGLSFSGSAYSTDGGRSFVDAGPVNPGPDLTSFLLGDPVLTCGNDRVFHYSQILSTAVITPTAFLPRSGVGVSRSVNGGATWADPTAAVLKDANTHFLDKPWHALDPQHPRRMFLTYTDFEILSPACSGAPWSAIELVRSVDGGATWGSPVVLEESCAGPAPQDLQNFVQGSQVVVDPSGKVIVAWEALTGQSRQLHVTRSGDDGLTFQRPRVATEIFPTGDGNLLQGGIRSNQFPSLAVDWSGGPTNGTIT